MSRLNFMGASPGLMSRMMKKRNVATLDQLVQAAKDLRVGLYACEMSMNILGMKQPDFIAEIKDVIGVPTFLKLSEGGETLFI
jgi:peroxiredoxin family protein